MGAVSRFFSGRNSFEARTPWNGWAAGFMSIGFILFQFAVAGLLGLVLVVLQLDLSIFNKGGFTASQVTMLIDICIVALFASYIITFGFIVFVAGLRGGTARDVLLFKRPDGFVLNLIIGLVLLVVFFSLLSFVIETFFAKDAQHSDAQMKQIFGAIRGSKLLWGGVAIIVIGAPILEETIFRGFLLTSLSNTRLGFWGAAIISSALWAMVHGYAASMAAGLFVFGLLLSLLVRRSGSIWISIIMHGVWNGVVTLGMFVAMGNSGL